MYFGGKIRYKFNIIDRLNCANWFPMVGSLGCVPFSVAVSYIRARCDRPPLLLHRPVLQQGCPTSLCRTQGESTELCLGNWCLLSFTGTLFYGIEINVLCQELDLILTCSQ